eukprot:scaffold505407_cov28-Prasinocladus_malaysianus.AAC.1
MIFVCHDSPFLGSSRVCDWGVTFLLGLKVAVRVEQVVVRFFVGQLRVVLIIDSLALFGSDPGRSRG